MSYKIQSLPSPRAYKEEKADFWEIQSLRNPGLFISRVNIVSALSKGSDEMVHDGITSEDDSIDDGLDEVFLELERRAIFSNKKYPFKLNISSIKINDDEFANTLVYKYMILCTRLNMKTKKIQNGIDGTLLFEKLCSYVAYKYFGKDSKSFVFGTAEPGSFQTKTTDLIKKIGEGTSFKNPNNNSPTANDDAIDVVVYKNFSDNRIGKLIAFCQCKTGTHWREDIKKLNPSEFCSRWLLNDPVLIPIPIVFICDTLNENFSFYNCQQNYLVFNRFRILEFIEDDIPDELLKPIQTWVEGAMTEIGINK